MNIFKKAEPQTVEVLGEPLKCPVCGDELLPSSAKYFVSDIFQLGLDK